MVLEESEWYSLVSIASSSLALLLAAYVVRKIPNRRAADTFVLAMVFFVLAGSFAERRYGPRMAKWTGDPEGFAGLQTMTGRLFL